MANGCVALVTLTFFERKQFKKCNSGCFSGLSAVKSTVCGLFLPRPQPTSSQKPDSKQAYPFHNHRLSSYLIMPRLYIVHSPSLCNFGAVCRKEKGKGVPNLGTTTTNAELLHFCEGAPVCHCPYERGLRPPLRVDPLISVRDLLRQAAQVRRNRNGPVSEQLVVIVALLFTEDASAPGGSGLAPRRPQVTEAPRKYWDTC